MEERIQYLFRRYLDNTCTRKEFDEFFAFICEAAHNETIRNLVKKLYDEMGHSSSSLTYVDECGNLVLTKPDCLTPGTAAPAKPQRKKVLAGMALAACIVIAIGTIWFVNRPVATTPATIAANLTKRSTARSEYKYLLLPDSTQVWLNAASTLEFPKTFGSKREVFLSGEAYFDVKHAEQIPFIIHTGKVYTTVLGTAFNIKAYPGRKNVVVSVSRGKVRVNYDTREVAVLTPGQQVKVNNDNNGIAEKKIAASEPASWQQGNMVYDDEALEDVIADLEQIYDVHVQIKNALLRSEPVSTTFRREMGIEEALQVLCKLTDTQLKQQNGIYIIQ
jgi:transmembrane sensor